MNYPISRSNIAPSKAISFVLCWTRMLNVFNVFILAKLCRRKSAIFFYCMYLTYQHISASLLALQMVY
ncbi:hypothetical protein V8C37DRAFT_395128 [Trichoderma ceciliae]